MKATVWLLAALLAFAASGVAEFASDMDDDDESEIDYDTEDEGDGIIVDDNATLESSDDDLESDSESADRTEQITTSLKKLKDVNPSDVPLMAEQITREEQEMERDVLSAPRTNIQSALGEEGVELAREVVDTVAALYKPKCDCADKCKKWGTKKICLKWDKEPECVAQDKRRVCIDPAMQCTEWQDVRQCIKFDDESTTTNKKCLKWIRERVCRKKKTSKVCVEQGTDPDCERKEICLRYKNVCTTPPCNPDDIQKKCTKWKRRRVCDKYKTVRGERVCGKWEEKSVCIKPCAENDPLCRTCAEWRDIPQPTGTPLPQRKCKRWETIKKCNKFKQKEVCAEYENKVLKGKCTEKPGERTCARYKTNKVCTKKCKRKGECKREATWGLVWAEPHVRTLDGHSYNMVWLGDYWLLKPKAASEEGSLAVQVRSEPARRRGLDGSMKRLHGAVFTAVAVRSGKDVIEAYTNPRRVRFNGKVAPTGKPLRLADGGTVTVNNKDEVAIVLPTLKCAVTVKWLKAGEGDSTFLDINTRLSEAVKGDFEGGLLGNYDGVKNNYNVVSHIKELAVTGKSTSLFSIPYKGPLDWKIYTDKEVQAKNPKWKEWARSECVKKGLKDGRLQACMYDLLVTGDAGYAAVEVDAKKQTLSDMKQFGLSGLRGEARQLRRAVKTKQSVDSAIAHENEREDDSDDDDDSYPAIIGSADVADDFDNDIADADADTETESDTGSRACSVGPQGAPSAPYLKPDTPGICIDTTKIECVGEVISGRCPGRGEYKCCIANNETATKTGRDKSVLGKAKMSELWCDKNVKCPKTRCSEDPGAQHTEMCRVGPVHIINGKYYSMRWHKTETVKCEEEEYCCEHKDEKGECAEWKTAAPTKECEPDKTERVCKRKEMKDTSECLSSETDRRCEEWTIPPSPSPVPQARRECARWQKTKDCLEHKVEKTCAQWTHPNEKKVCDKWRTDKSCLQSKDVCLKPPKKKCKRECVKKGREPPKKHCVRWEDKETCVMYGHVKRCGKWSEVQTGDARTCRDWKQVKRCVRFKNECKKWDEETWCTKEQTAGNCTKYQYLRVCTDPPPAQTQPGAGTTA